MTEFRCLDCNVDFSAPTTDVDEAFCPRCATTDWVIFSDNANGNFGGDSAMEWDSFVLASAGWGTDEDYGYYGD